MIGRTRIAAPEGDFDDFLRAERWPDIIRWYERGLSREEKKQPDARRAYAIALLRNGRSGSGVALLDSEVMALAETQRMLRRYVLPALIREKLIDRAIEIMDRLLLVDPDSIDDLRLRGSLRGRKRQFDLALDDAGKLITLSPDDIAGHTAYLQLLLQGGRIAEAGDHAAALVDRATTNDRLGLVALLSLSRADRWEEALALAAALERAPLDDAALPPVIVKTYIDAERLEQAIAAAHRFIEEGWDRPKLRAYLGQAYILSLRDDRYDRAIEHLARSVELDGDDPQARALLGEAMLRTGRYAEATEHLAKASAGQPRNAFVRAHYARALKQTGRFAEAAREFRYLLKLQPDSHRWHRYAAGAMSQAGQRAEAAELFDAFVAERAKGLPDDFASGLAALWDRVDSVELPAARLEWAWKLRHDRDLDRAEWERRALWGHLADHYILDWLECRDTQIHEAMRQLADLGEAERVLKGVDSSRGMILASAHIGPMYAGPLALELLGVSAKWLASTPSVARTSYAGSLISTSDQTSLQIAQQFMSSLRDGHAVVVAVDGAINMAAARIPFEGQEITYSSFAARTGHRLGIPSLFCAPRWEGQRIGFVLERLPDPQPDEEADDYAERWKAAYLAALRNYLGGQPENLRLGGGLWRHLRLPR